MELFLAKINLWMATGIFSVFVLIAGMLLARDVTTFVYRKLKTKSEPMTPTAEPGRIVLVNVEEEPVLNSTINYFETNLEANQMASNDA